jgi:hypothetical protein
MGAMIRLLPAGSMRLRVLVLVDLPVDGVIVLEQQERANHMQRSKQALHERWCVGRTEHVFVL